MYSLEYIIIAKIQIHYPIICRDFPHFVFWHHMGTICDVICYLICIIQNREYLWNERTYRKKENTVVCHFERPFYKLKLFFTSYALLESPIWCFSSSLADHYFWVSQHLNRTLGRQRNDSEYRDVAVLTLSSYLMALYLHLNVSTLMHCLFSWQVLHIHIILGIQDLLCVWFHALGLPHPGHCNCVCHHCVHLFPSKRWRLQMVSYTITIKKLLATGNCEEQLDI